MPGSRLVLDLETTKSFAEVGGAHNKHLLGISLVGLYDYASDRFSSYREGGLEPLVAVLQQAELVIGFNLLGFDYPVLAAELGDWVHDLPTYDIMHEVRTRLGHRLSLDALAQATLGSQKSGSGLDALDYYAQGDWERLERYCLQDVKLTRDLYDYIQREGMLYYTKSNKGKIAKARAGMHGSRRYPIVLRPQPYSALLQQAASERASIRLRYQGRERLLEVHGFDGIYLDGYDHSQQAMRRFRLDKIEHAERVASSPSLF